MAPSPGCLRRRLYQTCSWGDRLLPSLLPRVSWGGGPAAGWWRGPSRQRSPPPHCVRSPSPANAGEEIPRRLARPAHFVGPGTLTSGREARSLADLPGSSLKRPGWLEWELTPPPCSAWVPSPRDRGEEFLLVDVPAEGDAAGEV